MIRTLEHALHLFQLEGYSPKRYVHWWLKHPLSFKAESKVPLNMTWKATMLLRFTVFQLAFLIAASLVRPWLWPVTVLLIIFPFPLLFISLAILKPYEVWNKSRTINRVRQQVTEHPNLTVIGVTGSFGKTSTKDFLEAILSRWQPTLKTPLSYNTIFGIAKVVDYELVDRVRFFICEMGAYVRGEIKELTQMVPPNFAILTAIGSQHLERFGTLKNTTLAKFELVDAVVPEKALVNLDNEFIRVRLKQPRYRNVRTYSLKDKQADFFVRRHQLTAKGINFELIWQKRAYRFTSSLFGTSNLENLTAAVSMALMLGVPQDTIKAGVESLTPSPHRLELKTVGKATLIDNAYSSNEQGFKNVVADLKTLPGKKAILTPGLVELGDQSRRIHEELGRLLPEVFDQIYLVGQSERTEFLEKGIVAAKPTAEVKHLLLSNELWPTIETLGKTHDWILLENDLPDQY